jgi:hypothetical protein
MAEGDPNGAIKLTVVYADEDQGWFKTLRVTREYIEQAVSPAHFISIDLPEAQDLLTDDRLRLLLRVMAEEGRQLR